MTSKSGQFDTGQLIQCSGNQFTKDLEERKGGGNLVCVKLGTNQSQT